MRQITIDELYGLFDRKHQAGLSKALELPGTDGAVVYEHPKGDRPRTAVVFGPGRTHKTFTELGIRYFGTTPEKRQYPVALYSKRAIL